MANDCELKAKLFGQPENVKKFYNNLKELIKEKNFLGSDRYQMLFDFSDDVKDWGSKWQVFSNVELNSDEEIFITGYSAWCPADGLWEKISKDYQLSVTIEYAEPGMDFAGLTTWVKGEETDRIEMRYFEFLYQYDQDYFWEEIEYQAEWNTLDDMKESLGQVYTNLTDKEKDKLQEIHKERYTES